MDDTLSEKGIIQKNLIGNIDDKNSAQSCDFAKVGRESQREKKWTLFQNESKNRIDLLAGQLRIVQSERVGLVKYIKELKGSILETKAATRNESRDKENELQEMKNRHKVVLFEIDQHHKTALQKKIDCMKEHYETIQAELKKKGVKNQQLLDALKVMRTEAQRQSILFDNRELTLTRKLEHSNIRLAKLTASQAFVPQRSTTNESITQNLSSTQVVPKAYHQEDRELELMKREQRIHEAERVLQQREKHLEEREQCLLERDDKCRTILLEKDPVPDDLQTKGAGHTRLNTVEEHDHYITIRNHNVAKKDCGFEESLKKNKEQGNVKDKKMQSDDTIQEDNRAPNSELLGCTEVNSVSKDQVAASVLQNIHDESMVAPSKLAHTATTRRRSSEHQVAKIIAGQTLSSMLLQRSPPLPCVNFAYRKPAASGKNSKQNIVILDSSDSECEECEECDAKTIGIHIPKDPSSVHKNICRKSKELYQAVKLSRDKLFFVQYLAEGTTQRTLHLVQVNFEGRMYIAPKSNTLHHEGRYYVEFLGQCSKDKNLPWDHSRWWTEWHRYKIKSGTVVLLDSRTEFPPQKNPSEKKYLPYFDTLNLDDRAVFLLGPFDFEDPKPAVNRKNTTGRERIPQHVWKNLASVLRSDQATVALPPLSFGSAVTVKDDEKSRRGKRKRC